jgi:hypothetical protein
MAMLIWDPDVIASSDDLFKSQGPPVEISVIQTCSKGQPDPKDTNACWHVFQTKAEYACLSLMAKIMISSTTTMMEWDSNN